MSKNERFLIVIGGGPGLGTAFYQAHFPALEGFTVCFLEQQKEGGLPEWVDQLNALISQLTQQNQSARISLCAHSSGGCILSRYLKLYEVPKNIQKCIFLSCPISDEVDRDFLQWQKNSADQLPIDPSLQLPEELKSHNPLSTLFFDNWQLYFDLNSKGNLHRFFQMADFDFDSATNFYQKDFLNYSLAEDLRMPPETVEFIYLYPKNDKRITPNHIEKLSVIKNKILLKQITGSHFCFFCNPDEFKQDFMRLF